MNRELLVKLLMLTTSEQDGEALSAIRKANALLAAENLTWESLLLQQHVPMQGGVDFAAPQPFQGGVMVHFFTRVRPSTTSGGTKIVP